MPPRILVTRPEPAATVTAGRLREAGYEPVVLPLSRVMPLIVSTMTADEARGCAAVAVSSANAIRHAPPRLIAALTGKPCFAIGAHSAKVARIAGFDLVRISGGDGEDLARLVGEGTPDGAVVAYLCGRVRKATVERDIASSGRSVIPVETYDAHPIDYSPAELAHMVGNGRIDAVLLYSDRAALSFATLTSSGNASARFADIPLLGLSAGIGEALPGRCFTAASEPNEEALFAVLGRVVAATP
ncbi:MAG: uroporphyrinogen-III synthase [Rhizobiaceae bacterium]